MLAKYIERGAGSTVFGEFTNSTKAFASGPLDTDIVSTIVKQEHSNTILISSRFS